MTPGRGVFAYLRRDMHICTSSVRENRTPVDPAKPWGTFTITHDRCGKPAVQQCRWRIGRGPFLEERPSTFRCEEHAIDHRRNGDCGLDCSCTVLPALVG
jgi:hypothetical protein